MSLEDVLARAERGEKELNLVVKADVAGSLEALADEIARLPHEQVTVNVIRDGVGGISESDVMLAAASDAVVIGFNVRPVGNAAQVAEQEGVEIRTYSVIYNIVEELRAAMEGLLEAVEVEEQVGTAEVRATFKASRVGTIAGSYVTDGVVRRGAQCRLVRDGTVVYDGRIGSLRRFKDDVREVTPGMECGIVLENYPDVKEGDVIEVYEKQAGRADARVAGRYVCVLEIDLHFPETGSLKGKRARAVLVEGAAAAALRRGVAETDHHDLWQRAELTAALVGRDAGSLRDRAAEVERYVWGMFPDGARVECHVISSRGPALEWL